MPEVHLWGRRHDGIHLADTRPTELTASSNAAANFIAQTQHLSPRAFEAVTGTVMNGSYHTTLAAGKRWIAEGLPGSVLSTLTTWVWTGSPYVVPSAMAKAAVHAMTNVAGRRVGQVRHPGERASAWTDPHRLRVGGLNPTEKSSVGATHAKQVPARRSRWTAARCSPAPGTFAGLNSLSDADWPEIKQRSKAASEATRPQRSI